MSGSKKDRRFKTRVKRSLYRQGYRLLCIDVNRNGPYPFVRIVHNGSYIMRLRWNWRRFRYGIGEMCDGTFIRRNPEHIKNLLNRSLAA